MKTHNKIWEEILRTRPDWISNESLDINPEHDYSLSYTAIVNNQPYEVSRVEWEEKDIIPWIKGERDSLRRMLARDEKIAYDLSNDRDDS